MSKSTCGSNKNCSPFPLHGIEGLPSGRRRIDLQQRRQEAQAEKQKERLDYALLAIRDHGGSISRKQLTEILVKKFEVSRQTISGIISGWLNDKLLFESDGNIQSSPDIALAF